MSWLCESTVGAWRQFLTVKSLLALCLFPRHDHPYRFSASKSRTPAGCHAGNAPVAAVFYVATKLVCLGLENTTAANDRALTVAHTPGDGRFVGTDQRACLHGLE